MAKRKIKSDLYGKLRSLHSQLDERYRAEFDRSLPLNEELTDRWDRAKRCDFGNFSSVYDSVLIFGKPSVGEHCWIGPFTIIDGSGGLTIGNWCTISAGVHIYSHDNISQTLTSGSEAIQRAPVIIGNNVYIGPHSVITRGVHVGDCSIIGGFSLVNRDVEPYTFVAGQPARVRGNVRMVDGKPQISASSAE